jgi:hypothetical protein
LPFTELIGALALVGLVALAAKYFRHRREPHQSRWQRSASRSDRARLRLTTGLDGSPDATYHHGHDGCTSDSGSSGGGGDCGDGGD